MFYLEDYLEKLEYLPETIRSKLTKIGSMDHTVMMSMHDINKKINALFSKANSMSSEELETQFNAIMVDGEIPIQKSEEKIMLADEMEDQLSKYIAGLDQDLHKFKMELEADYCGITEQIEKRSLESEQSSDNVNVNVRHPPQKRGQMNRRLFGGNKEDMLLARNRPKQRPLTISSTSNVAHSSKYNLNFMALPKSLEQTKTWRSTACSSTAPSTSQISNTHQFSRNRSINTSDESIEVVSPDISFGSGIGQNELLSELSIDETKSASQRKKKKNTGNLTVSTEEDVSVTTDEDTARYCICNDFAYGTMVACDNKMCPHEWFHCECVGIKNAPKGKWYCPKCRKSPTKNRKSRKTTSA